MFLREGKNRWENVNLQNLGDHLGVRSNGIYAPQRVYEALDHPLPVRSVDAIRKRGRQITEHGRKFHFPLRPAAHDLPRSAGSLSRQRETLLRPTPAQRKTLRAMGLTARVIGPGAETRPRTAGPVTKGRMSGRRRVSNGLASPGRLSRTKGPAGAIRVTSRRKSGPHARRKGSMHRGFGTGKETRRCLRTRLSAKTHWVTGPKSPRARRQATPTSWPMRSPAGQPPEGGAAGLQTVRHRSEAYGPPESARIPAGDGERGHP